MQLVDQFEVHHSRLDSRFFFSCSSGLDTVGETVRAHGLAAYEAPVMDIVLELVKSRPGVFLDIGANTGLYSLVAAAGNPSNRVIAFEPLHSVCELLKANIALNPEIASRIIIEPVGLSSEIGSFTFYETINNLGLVSTSSSLEQSHAEQVGGEYVEHVIRTITLDSFGDTLGDIDVSFMKIDVEGHEHAVISGGRRFLAKHRPFLTLEILGPAETSSIDSFLLEADYLDFAMAPGVLRNSERAKFFSDAWNHLLVPAEQVDLVLAICRRLGLQLDLS